MGRSPPVTLFELPHPVASAQVGGAERAATLGDRAAWETLIARHQHRVMVALVARGVAPTKARDFAQEAWLRLIAQSDARKLERLELPGLAIRQALFLARTAARSEARELSVPPEALSLPDDAPSAEAVLVSREALGHARRVLGGMHVNARRTFELLYGEPPHTTAETAATLGLSLQRVRQIVCEVRAALRHSLKGAP